MIPLTSRKNFNLTLIRHAKSSWRYPGLSDFDRPLSRSGQQAAPVVGGLLASLGYSFDGVYSSSARRAIETAQQVATKTGFKKRRIQCTGNLYTFESRRLLHFIRTVDDSKQSIAIVGHDPALTALASELASTPVDSIPACGVIHLHCAINSWAELDLGAGVLKAFVYPKRYLLAQ